MGTKKTVKKRSPIKIAGKDKKRSGKGLLNSIINKLPFEAHLPGYQYCGPGTKLKERLKRNDPGINGLDRACKEHDIAYAETNETAKRNIADKILAKKALERIKSSDASLGERSAALGVAGIMMAKSKMGMGLKKQSGGCLKKSCKKKTSIEKKDISAAKVKAKKKPKASKNTPRIIPAPKIGGVLPLVPIFAGLSALGALMGGSAGVANAVISANKAKKDLKEVQRHNETMEAIALGNRNGKGLYLLPHKNGSGLYLTPDKNGSGLYLMPHEKGSGLYLMPDKNGSGLHLSPLSKNV